MSDRIVEAYIGEYASGKSENAVNRALALQKSGRQVILADLDIVEPFYTLRPIKKLLQEQDIKVLAWDTRDTTGLGETGNILKPEMKWALHNEGDIILDIGYGVEGAKTLNLVEGAAENEDLKIILVLNIGRPMTSDVRDIIEHAAGLGRIDGIINNSHLGDQTDVEFVQMGAKIVTEAAGILGVPIIATSVADVLAEQIGEHDCMGNPIRVLTRLMQNTFW